MSGGRALLAGMRPRQWVKNVLVVAGPIAAGRLFDPVTLSAVAVAFGTFSLAASAIYLVNDVLDREADRLHPTKRHRPVASGALPVPLALVAAGVLIVAAHGLALLLGYVELAAVLAVYTVLQLAYCAWLKRLSVIELAVVASGFLLRAIAGGAAADVDLSPWFLLVASFGSLFVVAGKRFSEVAVVGEGQGATRRALELYSANYLRFVWGMAGAATLTFYSLWAFDLERENLVLPQISVAPFVVALLRYAVDIDKGAAGEPETIVLGDRVLQALGVTWLAVFVASALVG